MPGGGSLDELGADEPAPSRPVGEAHLCERHPFARVAEVAEAPAGSADRGEFGARLAAAPPPEDWRRVRVTPDVELHVRADAAPAVRRRLDRMVEALRRILES